MSIINAIGNTPLVELKNIYNSRQSGVRILAKFEGANPGGSIKDRPALYMIERAIEQGLLTHEKILLEPTSGNTGIGMAMVASAMGYRIKLTMPACVSEERRSILRAFGADLELTPGCERTDGAIVRARQIMQSDHEHYYMPDQFSNEHNWQAHYKSTAPEIWRQTKGDIDVFVAGMGTTGTLMGCSRYFKEKNEKIKIVGIEPTLNHRIQGLKNMQESIVPAIYERFRLDDVLVCQDMDAFDMIRRLSTQEGLFCGLSSGAAIWAAMALAQSMPRGTTVVTILPDRGDRYLSTEVFRSFCSQCPP